MASPGFAAVKSTLVSRLQLIVPVCWEKSGGPGLLEVDLGMREEDLKKAKRVSARAPDTRVITPYRS